MRFLLALAVLAAFVASSFAQSRQTVGQAPPQRVPSEVTARDTIELRIGQTKLLSTDRSIVRLESTSETVALAQVGSTDQFFTIRAVGPGESLLTVGYSDGTFARMNINVGGRIVRIYGAHRDNAKDYTGHFCTNTECSRADTDVVAPVPGSISVSRTTRDSSGGVNTITKNY